MKKVIVGMSGGVDSSVAALLLKQQGYDVEGLFMKNWEEDDNTEYCTAAADLNDAQKVCDKIGIKLHIANFAADYWDNVFSIFLAEYAAGRTPNPDILCNSEIKFKAFLDYARLLKADFIATGHYVRSSGSKLLKGLDDNKDQSYFLCNLNAHQVSSSLFPIGALQKSEVRKIAAERGFITADKKDSTGICFIGERKFKEFLSRYLPAKPGVIRSAAGDILGKHDGLMYHTIGQRQGLNIGGINKGTGEAWYVAAKDLATNELIVVQGKNHPLLFKNSLLVKNINWINDKPAQLDNLFCKIRYRQQDQACRIEQIADGFSKVIFAEPQRAVTAGQSIVFYQQDECLGGAVIEST